MKKTILFSFVLSFLAFSLITPSFALAQSAPEASPGISGLTTETAALQVKINALVIQINALQAQIAAKQPSQNMSAFPTPTSKPAGKPYVSELMQKPYAISATSYLPTLITKPMPTGPLYLKMNINGSDNPKPVQLNTPFEVTWKSTGTQCNGWGSHMTRADGKLWGSTAMPSSGSVKVIAAHNNFPNITGLTVGVQCWSADSQTSDSQSMNILVSNDSPSIEKPLPITDKPSIEVISPDGGESWFKDVTQVVKWGSQNIPSDNQITIALRHYPDGNPNSGNYQDYGIFSNVNDGVEKINIDSYPVGVYNLQVKTVIGNYNIISDWSGSYFKIYPARGGGVYADVTGDGLVNVNDLLAVINAWGPCETGQVCPADINGDKLVNQSDIDLVIKYWTNLIKVLL